jgi:hypothetical protein
MGHGDIFQGCHSYQEELQSRKLSTRGYPAQRIKDAGVLQSAIVCCDADAKPAWEYTEYIYLYGLKISTIMCSRLPLVRRKIQQPEAEQTPK